jgi:hypothetical protein
MPFFLGIYNSDIIESAHDHQSANTSAGAVVSVCRETERAGLAQDWAGLVDLFSWRKQPCVSVQISENTKDR